MNLIIGLILFIPLYLVSMTRWFRRRVFPCKGRTRTKLQTIFTLSHPHPVVFDFSTQQVILKILQNSAWESQRHWVGTAQECMSLEVLAGSAIILIDFVGGRRASGTWSVPAGFHFQQEPEQILSFGRDRSPPSEDKLLDMAEVVYGLNVDHDLYRTLCSVNQDAEVYMQLYSTPILIRLIYSALRYLPIWGYQARESMVKLMLGIQIRAINHANNKHTYEGDIDLSMFWFFRSPHWVDVLRIQSVVPVSKIVLFMSYWVGTLFLGMQTKYEEYDTIEIAPSAEQQV